ncbi:MAG: peptide chain release factor N(5)-glutamine methyltransferase [Lachnospiraceae bacterium]|nr:peptide chain release factor N(5)-glutamine methyltransferase [Lachnospiraceae bacterium]
MILRDMLKQGADTLRKAGVIEPGLDAWYLLSYCMGITKSRYYMMQDEIPDNNTIKRYNELINERSTRKPLQYITGSQEFMGLAFAVNENVLIPRQDTEVLVERAMGLCRGRRILDMCTGSGCIAVSIAVLGRPESVDASDISEAALQLAKKNSIKNGASVSFILSDIWDNITGEYDVVISNPPYVTAGEMGELMPEVGTYEPGNALYGGCDGLEFYKRIVSGAHGHLAKNGYIFFEIGCKQSVAVSKILAQNGFGDIRTEKDLSGLDRVVWARRK